MKRAFRIGRRTAAWLALACLPATACAGGATGLNGILTGRWGGSGVSVVLADSGGTVEFDCAHGRFGPVLLEDGQFQLEGTWTRETGAIRIGEEPEEEPASYAGLATGDLLVFTVHVAGQPEPFGPYSARRGQEPLLLKCL